MTLLGGVTRPYRNGQKAPEDFSRIKLIALVMYLNILAGDLDSWWRVDY